MRNPPLFYGLNSDPCHPIKAATERARVVIARIAILCIFYLLSACTESVNLQTGLNDRDANEIVSLLNRHGIEAKKHSTKEGVTLTVKDAEISRATEVMQAAGLPKRSLSNLGQIFKKEGMISTPLEERVRYIYGLSAELENTLQQFDNVVSARVHVVLPERVAPGEPMQPSSASVFIKYRQPFDEETAVPRIRKLVATSIPGLSGDDARSKVSVVLTPTESVAAAIEWTTVGPFSVQAASAGTLIATLIGLTVLSLLSLGGVILLMLRNPNVIAWIQKCTHARPAFNAQDGNETTAAAGQNKNKAS